MQHTVRNGRGCQDHLAIPLSLLVMIQYPASGIRHPTSGIWHLASAFAKATADKVHPVATNLLDCRFYTSKLAENFFIFEIAI